MTFVLDHIALSQGDEVIIDDVSLTLEQGTTNVLLGPTLAGKTTLMRLMAGLDKPTSGRLLIDGSDVTQVPVRRRSVAMVYQQFVNYPSMTVYDNIASPLRVAGLSKAEIASRVKEAARCSAPRTPCFSACRRNCPAASSNAQPSHGLLVKRADLVLLDEPLANLDYKLREELREELPRIFAQTGAILVYATTEPTEALLLGGNTVTMWQGRVTQTGPTASVYRMPDNLDAARVFSDPPLNELPLDKKGALCTLPNGRHLPALGLLSQLPDGAYRLGFRADAVTVGEPQPASIDFPGQVAITELSGSESFVHVDVGLGVWVCLVPGVREWLPGANVEVRVDAARAFVFDASGKLAVAPTIAKTA